MAKKKKSKVGNLISKVKDKIVNAAKSVGISNLGTIGAKQPVFKARVGEGLTPQQASAAQAVVIKKVEQPSFAGKIGLSTNQLSKAPGKTPGKESTANYPGLSGNVPAGISFSGKASDISGALSSGGLTIRSGGTNIPLLQKAEAPDSADAVLSAARAPSVNMGISSSSTSPSTTAMGIGSTAGANAAVAGVEQVNNQRLQEQQQLQQSMLDTEGEKKSILDQLFKEQKKEPTREELRQEYEEAFKIQEQTAQINSLQQDLDKVLNEVSNQEAVARDRLGTNDFINNQIAQIRRNSEPIINQLSSEIKWRSGLLSEDRAMMNEAISDALADSRSRIETNRWFANEYIGMLDKKYQQAYDQYMKQEERAYDERQGFLEYARDVAWEYAQNGISFNINPYTITPEELAEKIARNPLPQKSSGGGSSSYRFSNTQLNTGAARAGLSREDFIGLDPEVQNFFVSAGAGKVSDAVEIASLANTGEATVAEAEETLKIMGISQVAIDYLLSGSSASAPVENKKQSFWSRISNVLSGGYKDILGR